MAKASSIHFVAAKNSADKHNKREKDLDYVRKELEEHLPLEKWYWEHPDYTSVAKMKKQAEKEYYSKEITVTGNHGTYVTHRSMPKNAEPVKEGVVAINQNVTMEQLRAFGEWTRQEYGITPMAIYIHLGEGHWAPLDEEEGQTEDMYRRNDGHEWKRVNELGETEYWKPNLHAHMVYDWFDHDSKRCFNLGPSVMRRLEDELPKFLNMERGLPSDRKWLDSVAFKSKAERERAAKEKQRIFSDIDKWKQEAEDARIEAEKWQKETAKQHKAMTSLETMIANIKDKLEKGEGDVQELEEKLQDKQAKLEEKQKAYISAVGKKDYADMKLREAQEKLDEINSQVSLASAELDKKNAEIAQVDSKLESANDRIRSAEQKASAKESEATSRINQAESLASQKEREAAAKKNRIDLEQNAAEGKLDRLKVYASAAEVKQEQLRYPTLNLTQEEKKLVDDIKAEMETPVGIWQSAKSWGEERRRNIMALITAFRTSVEAKVTTENNNLRSSANKMFTFYMQQVDNLKTADPNLSEVVDAKFKADILRALLKDLQHEELSMYIDENPDELGKFIKAMYDRQLNGMADYLYQATFRHKSRKDLAQLANQWRIWQSRNSSLFDSQGRFDNALKEAAFCLGDKVWDDKDDNNALLKAFNEVVRVAEQNAQEPFMWGRKNAENIAESIRLINAPHINYSQDDKAKAILDDVVSKCDITIAENKRNQDAKARREAEDARKAYITSLYNSKTMKNAVKDVVAKSSDTRAFSLNPSQALNIISALSMFGEDEREAAADKMMDMARAEASCPKAWLESTAEEVAAIAENFAQIAVILALPTQGAAVSTGGGGGGGNNDLPKKRDDDWWNKLCKIMNAGGRKKGGLGR